MINALGGIASPTPLRMRTRRVAEISFLRPFVGAPMGSLAQTRQFEVRDVAYNDRQAVNHRGRGDQGIAFGPRVGNVKLRATLRHGSVNSQDAKRGRI